MIHVYNWYLRDLYKSHTGYYKKFYSASSNAFKIKFTNFAI